MTTSSTCAVCGQLVESAIPADWHPSKLRLRAEHDMQQHLRTHSFAELLRFEIRQDLEQVPDEQRPSIVRDIYRHLLGTREGDRFALNDPDGRASYTIDEALGLVSLYRLWHDARRCRAPGCPCAT